jgi:hypothetical protein
MTDRKIDYVTFDDDPDGLDWKAPIYDKDGTPRPQIVLMALAYRDGSDDLVDSLSTIDFYQERGDWIRGTFRRVRDIPARCAHLREVAEQLGLKQ